MACSKTPGKIKVTDHRAVGKQRELKRQANDALKNMRED